MTPAARVQPGPAGVSVVVGPALTGRLLAFVATEVERMRRQDACPAHPDVLQLLGALRAAEGANAQLRARGFASETKIEEAEPDPGGWLVMRDVASGLGCSLAWARKLARSGAFPGARRLGRDWLVPRVDVAMFASRRAQGSVAV